MAPPLRELFRATVHVLDYIAPLGADPNTGGGRKGWRAQKGRMRGRDEGREVGKG